MMTVLQKYSRIDSEKMIMITTDEILYFPMQKRAKMLPRMSWVVISPVISPR